MMGWQDNMRQAPDDGSEVLLYFPKLGMVLAKWNAELEEWEDTWAGDVIGGTPTRWTIITPPPEGQSDE